MGSGFSVLKKAVVIQPISKDDLDWLLGHTKREEKQIVDMHKKFHTDYPSGNILRHQFAQLLPPGIVTQHFCDHVFRTLDTDGNGNLDFREYVIAMDLVEAKTPEDKLKWAFKMYDVDKSGAIDKKEMAKVMTSIYVMLTTSDDNKAKQNAEEQATAHAAKLFKEVDVNNDGELSEDEFIDGCKKDKELMMKLQQLVDQCMGK